MIHVFGDCELDTDRYELRRAGTRCPVQPQVFDVLAYLAANPDRVVTREELLAQVWGHSYVSEATLSSRIMAARKAIGDDGRAQAMIRTVRGRGYRFVAPAYVAHPVAPGGDAHARVAPLVGRDAERAELDRVLGEALDGQRRLVLVTGEAGIGKTALVEAFAAGAADRVEVLTGRCVEQQGPAEAYMPVLEALGGLDGTGPGRARMIRVLVERAPTWLLQMPWLADARALEEARARSVGAGAERMLREMVQALEALSVQRPLLLVLDDLQWSDEATVTLLTHLARGPEPARLMVAGTSRPAAGHALEGMLRELRPRGRCAEIVLPLLSRDAVAEYLAWRRPGLGALAGLASEVHRRTDGNPLFIECLVNSLSDEEGQEVAAGGLGSAVPETLRDLIEQEITALDVEDLTMVEAASVVGRSFSAAAVAAGAGAPVDEVERRCADLARRRRFLRRGGEAEWPDGTVAASFSFIHDVHRQVLYDRLPAGRRVGLHRAIGDRLEAGYADRAAGHAAELAGHHIRGRQPAPAVRYLELSARQAIARGAPAEAVRDLRAALGLLESAAGIADAASELALQVALGGALVASEGYGSPAAESALRRAVELAPAREDDPSAAVLLHALAGLHEYRGNYRLSEQLAGEAIRAASACGAGPRLLEAHEMMACSLFHQGRHRAALEQAEQALSLQEAGFEHRLVALHGEDPVVSSHDWAGLTLWCMGHPDPALERIRTAVEIASAPGRLHSLANAHVHAARLRQMRAEPQEAAHHAELALTLADEHGFAYHRAVARILLGWARAVSGAAEEGLALLRDGLDAHRATGALMDRPYFLGLLAEALGAANRPADGLRTVAEALGMLDGGRTFFYEPELHRLRGCLMLREPQGDPAEALASLRRAVELARRQDAHALELRAALALARLRPAGEEARSALEAACSRFDGDESSLELAEARSLLPEGA